MCQWARKGSRPSQPADQRYESAYLFGAVCPARDTGAALAMPSADTEAMQKHLDEIARTVATGAHAIVLLDRAGWHTTDKLKTPKNLTLLPIPPASPELNAAENIWQYLRQTYLSQPHLQGLRRDHRAASRFPLRPGPRLSSLLPHGFPGGNSGKQITADVRVSI